MGFFSWDCKECDESIKAPHGIPKQMAWQNECVATNGENTIKGEYDGYGTVGGIDIAEVGDSYAFYHRRCWDKPGDFIFDKPSQPSNDQGYFYDPIENELTEKGNKEET